MPNPELPAVKKEILVRLLRAQSSRYSDAMPAGVPNDLYNYHLQHLIKQGYVQKIGSAYSLTTAGKKFAESTHLLLPSGDTGKLFRVNVLVILFKQVDGKQYVLNQTRTCHPYYGDKGIIGGPVKHGELVEDAYARVLCDETGLIAQPTTAGIIRKVRYTPDDALFSDIFFHVGIAYDHSGTLEPATVFGENYWAPYEVALENEAQSVQGGKRIVEVLRGAGTNKNLPFFYHQERMTVTL